MKIKLANKLLALFLIVSVLPLAIVGWVAYHKTTETIETLQYEKLDALIDERAKKAEELFYERTHDVSLLARSPLVIELLRVYSEAFASGGIESPTYKQTEQERGHYLLDYAAALNIADLLLITANGDIVFSSAKNIDLGTNIRTGPYNQSALNRVFKLATNGELTKDATVEIYPPLGAPAIFIAAPIMTTNGIAGILAFEVPATTIYSFAQDYIGLGDTGETVLASLRDEQVIMVAPTRHDPEAALKRSVRMGSDDALPIQKAVDGNTGSGQFTDYRGVNVLAVWRHLPSMNIGMVMKIDHSEVFAPIYTLGKGFALMGLLTTLTVLAMSSVIARSISAPVIAITEATARMANGDTTVRTNVQTQDEIGILASSFNQMAEHLNTAKEETETRNWLNMGMAGLDDTMRGEKELSLLCTDIIAYLARTLDAQVGTLSLANSEKSELTLAGSYAYKEPSGTATTFRFGEGLVGQAAEGKKRILVTDVPQNYIAVTSALGEATPRNILCIPLLYEGTVKGVVELGSLQTFTELQLQFLEQTTERIAIAIQAAQSRERLKTLLEESQAQSEELQAQQEELQAQQEELRVANEELEEKNEELLEQKGPENRES